MSFFIKEKEELISAVFDISSGHISGSLVIMRKGKLPLIVYTRKEYFEKKKQIRIRNSKRLEHSQMNKMYVKSLGQDEKKIEKT